MTAMLVKAARIGLSDCPAVSRFSLISSPSQDPTVCHDSKSQIMPEKKEENNANLVFVLENCHKMSSASPLLWQFACGMHIHAGINIQANHGYVTFKHRRAQSSQGSHLN